MSHQRPRPRIVRAIVAICSLAILTLCGAAICVAAVGDIGLGTGTKSANATKDALAMALTSSTEAPRQANRNIRTYPEKWRISDPLPWKGATIVIASICDTEGDAYLVRTSPDPVVLAAVGARGECTNMSYDQENNVVIATHGGKTTVLRWDADRHRVTRQDFAGKPDGMSK